MITKLRALVLVGCLATAPSAFAIPLGVDILGGTGTWQLTSAGGSISRDWAVFFSDEFEIAPGNYSWSIDGWGLGAAWWRVTLNGDTVYSGSASGSDIRNLFYFEIDDDFRSQTAPVTSVPEPGTLALLGIGIAALGFVARRKGSKVSN